jgi:hypothetical protein
MAARVAVDGIKLADGQARFAKRQVSGGERHRLSRDNDHNLLNINEKLYDW